ncbi:MAG: hypothetical protein AAB769_02425 [Patescibacteria group bacterium]
MFLRHIKTFLLALVIVFSFSAFGTDVNASHSWENYHWARTANPFTLKVGDNMSTAWDAYLSTASADWSFSSVLDTAVVPGLTTAKRCKPTTGRVEACNSTYGKNGWLGVAQIWISGGHITQGIVKMNDTYFNTRTYNTPAWRQMVVCQEVGHTFGLDHQDENFSNPNLGTCMDYTNNPLRDDDAGNNIHPNLHDYTQLETIYAHLDTITTILSGTLRGAAATAEAENENDWGREIKGERGDDKKRKESHYERDLGNGNKIHTFVVWAE